MYNWSIKYNKSPRDDFNKCNACDPLNIVHLKYSNENINKLLYIITDTTM